MSIPIRALDGCIRGVRGLSLRYDRKPWYMAYGSEIVSPVKSTCEQHRINHHAIEIIWWGRVVGWLEWNAYQHGPQPRYIVIGEHNNRRLFRWHDVYCREHNEWHFAH